MGGGVVDDLDLQDPRRMWYRPSIARPFPLEGYYALNLASEAY